MIQQTIKCIRCGYNLRGLREDGNCPECNAPIAKSLETRRNAPWCLATLIASGAFALFHFLFVAIPILTPGGGESDFWLVACFDFPILKILDQFPKPTHESLIIVWGGTLLYGVFGAAVGLVIDLGRWNKRRRLREQL